MDRSVSNVHTDLMNNAPTLIISTSKFDPTQDLALVTATANAQTIAELKLAGYRIIFNAPNATMADMYAHEDKHGDLTWKVTR